MSTRETATTALARFDEAWTALDKTVQSLSERELSEIRDPAGWAAKDHLMHVAIWEQALLATLDGRARHAVLGLDASTDGSEDWDGLNAMIFGATRSRSLTDVLEALRTTHNTTRSTIASFSAGDTAPKADAFLADVPGYADHYDQHHGWIKTLVGRS
jgi:hypothetical protein